MARPTKEEQERKKQNQYVIKSLKKTTKMFGVRFHNEYDKDILEYLATIGNFSAYIKKLIREDIKRSNNK
jgi:hypothetical protein